METITKKINNLGTEYTIIFDVVNSDHGDSGWQWYYGTLLVPEQKYEGATLVHTNKEFEFSICVIHYANSDSFSTELTWIDDAPSDKIIEGIIYQQFDWSEINDEHEQNEIELEKIMEKIRNENF